MRKGDKLLLIIFIILVITTYLLNILGKNVNDGKHLITFSFIVIALWIIFVIFIIVMAVRSEKNNNIKAKIIVDYIKNDNYEKALICINENIEKALFDKIALKNKILLVLVELLENNNDKAKNLIDSTKWGVFVINVYYYRALIHLRENEINMAKQLFEKLRVANKRNKGLFNDQLINLEKLINYVENGTLVELETKLPIVKELLKTRK